MKDRSYESLVAGMRKAPSYTSAEEVIARDFKIKLPTDVTYTCGTHPRSLNFGESRRAWTKKKRPGMW